MTSDELWQPEDIQEDSGPNTTDSDDEWPDEGNDTGNDDHTSVPGLDLSTEYGDENEGGWTKVTDGLGPDPTLDDIGYTQRDITQDYHRIAQLEAIVKGPDRRKDGLGEPDPDAGLPDVLIQIITVYVGWVERRETHR